MTGRARGGGVTRQCGGRYDLAPVAAVHPRPTSARSGPLAAPRRTRVVVAVGALALAALLGTAPAAARPAQDPGATSVPIDASSTTSPAFTTTTVAAVPAEEPVAPEADDAGTVGTSGRRVADENRKIWGVVAGLVLVAIALSLLTIRYWRKTRPVPPTTGLMLPTDAALAVALASTPEPSTPEPSTREASGEASAGDGPAPEPSGEQTPGVSIVGGVHDDPVYDAGNDTAPVPVVDAPDAEPASARRAVAGADHATADEAWEPRGTGEHERVVVPAVRATRLSAEQRAALFAQREPREP